jgi:hypothetical protein
VIAACLFEKSDRARALLLKVVEKYRDTPFKTDFDREYNAFKKMIDSMRSYKFEKNEFDSGSAELRLEAVRKVLQHKPTA